MIFEWLPAAKKDYLWLPKPIRAKADKAFRLFERNPWHPSLHTEKVDPIREIWSARIDKNYRLTFQWVRGGVLIRRIGSHQKAYRKP
ncbi:MAG: hypothetical protein HY922_05920 [Elusimicrobia bacterium]|nr:hypothetical protein [Elusimicrobiota bacterium]